MKQTIIS